MPVALSLRSRSADGLGGEEMGQGTYHKVETRSDGSINMDVGDHMRLSTYFFEK